MGLIGGGLAVLLLGQSAVFALVSPGDASRLVAIPLAAMAAVYVPAVWVSARATPRRQTILRRVVAVSLVLIVLGVFLFGPVFATLLLIPSTLLAIAAGLVFQGSTKAKR